MRQAHFDTKQRQQSVLKFKDCPPSPRSLMRRASDNTANQRSLSDPSCPPPQHAASLLFIYTLIHQQRLCLARPRRPERGIIRTGRQEGKSENVSECA